VTDRHYSWMEVSKLAATYGNHWESNDEAVLSSATAQLTRLDRGSLLRIAAAVEKTNDLLRLVLVELCSHRNRLENIELNMLHASQPALAMAKDYAAAIRKLVRERFDVLVAELSTNPCPVELRAALWKAFAKKHLPAVRYDVDGDGIDDRLERLDLDGMSLEPPTGKGKKLWQEWINRPKESA
jgi:hypothetical protein